MATEVKLALTLRRPWAAAVVHLGKAIENRTWKPPVHAIGQLLAIHAGRNIEPDALDFIRSIRRDFNAS